jgi:hypothetical protein
MSGKKLPEVKIEIQLDEETAQGVYVNLAMVNHTEAEFIIDFVFVQPQAAKAKVRSRVITSPRHLKRLIAALQENLRRFEEVHGPVSAGQSIAGEAENYH